MNTIDQKGEELLWVMLGVSWEDGVDVAYWAFDEIRREDGLAIAPHAFDEHGVITGEFSLSAEDVS